MNFEKELSLKNLKRKSARTAALVILSAFLSFSIFGGSLVVMSLQNGLKSYEARLGADIIVVPNQARSHGTVDAILLQGIPGSFYMDESYYEKIAAREGVEAASPQFFLASASAGCCSVAVQIIGFDPETDFSIQPWIRESYGGKVNDGDSVVLFNFRGDRALEISMAFDGGDDFKYFDRGAVPKVIYAGMLEYDGDLKIPNNYLVNPPEIKNTLSEVLVNAGLNSYAVSETQKYGHVTYFWNGNRSEKFSEELETWKEIPSDNVSFDQRPWMKSAEITDDMIEAIKSQKYDFIRCNYPNGDMVGHTGSMDATLVAVEAVDLGLTRLLKVAEEYDCTVLITADHGNADEMLEKNKKGEINVRTAHSLNRVPFFIVSKDKYEIIDAESTKYGLANVAPTVLKIFGIKAPDCWEASMI